MYSVKRSSCITAPKYLNKIHTNMEYKQQLFDWLPISASSLKKILSNSSFGIIPCPLNSAQLAQLCMMNYIN
jgi:hypothetical protein